MKISLRVGLSLLALLLFLASVVSYGEGKVPLMILAMGVALWTAFSLPAPTPPKHMEEEDPSSEAWNGGLAVEPDDAGEDEPERIPPLIKKKRRPIKKKPKE